MLSKGNFWKSLDENKRKWMAAEAVCHKTVMCQCFLKNCACALICMKTNSNKISKKGF